MSVNASRTVSTVAWRIAVLSWSSVSGASIGAQRYLCIFAAPSLPQTRPARPAVGSAPPWSTPSRSPSTDVLLADRPGAGPPEGRGARRRRSPTTTCARATAAATSSCAWRARTRRCWGSTAPASARRPRRPPRPASGPRSSPTSTSRRVPGHRVPARAGRDAARDLGKPDMIAEVAVTLWEVHGMPAAAQPLLGLGRGRPLRAHRRRARRRLARHVRRPARSAPGGSRPRSTRRIPSTRRCRATTTCCRPT